MKKIKIADALRGLGYNQSSLRARGTGKGPWIRELARNLFADFTAQGFTHTRGDHLLTEEAIYKAICNLRRGLSHSNKPSMFRRVKKPAVKKAPASLPSTAKPMVPMSPLPRVDVAQDVTIETALNGLLNAMAILEQVALRIQKEHTLLRAKVQTLL